MWTFCIGMGLIKCAYARISSKSGPFPFDVDFLYISCIQYWGKLELWSHSAMFWTRLWTFCICVGLFRCAYVKISSKSGPYSLNVDFLYISCVQYRGKLDLWNHSAKFWTRLWTYWIGMGLFECAYVKITTISAGPISVSVDFLVIFLCTKFRKTGLLEF